MAWQLPMKIYWRVKEDDENFPPNKASGAGGFSGEGRNSQCHEAPAEGTSCSSSREAAGVGLGRPHPHSHFLMAFTWVNLAGPGLSCARTQDKTEWHHRHPPGLATFQPQLRTWGPGLQDRQDVYSCTSSGTQGCCNFSRCGVFQAL